MVKNVGTHVLKVKNEGTVELIVQSADLHRTHKFDGHMTPSNLNVGAVELMGKNSTAPVELKNTRS